MVEIDDLWIGDLLLLKKSGRVGKFNGRSGHKKVRVRIGEKIVITPIGNIEIAPEDAKVEQFDYSHRPQKKKISQQKLSNSIDLHIEVLNPSLKSSRVEHILDFQIKAAKNFINTSIENSTKKITIIHGKGEGVLKSEVLHILSFYNDVQFTFDKNSGGTTEVWFK